MAGAVSRRHFVGGVAAAASWLIVPRHVLGGEAKQPPSQRMGQAVVGLGRGMGMAGSGTLAACDVDRKRLDAAVERAGGECRGYTDFRYILDRKDIDRVLVATPPHWHAPVSIMAMKAGKNVFCEKPLTRTIGEGRAFVEAVRSYGCAFSYGAHTETPHHALLRKVAHSGILGSPLTVYMRGSKGCNFKVGGWTGMVNQVPQPAPPTLDWNLYCGPSPLKPYHPHRTHGSFRGYWDYDGGGLTDMAPHVFNELLGNMGKDDTSPVEVETSGPPAHDDAVGIFHWSRLKYADGTVLFVDSGVGQPRDGADPNILFEGPNGRVLYSAEAKGALVSDPPRVLDELKNAPNPPSLSRLGGLPRPLAAIIHAHRTNCLAILINISLRVGRRIRFDPVKEEVVGDDEANRLVRPPMRAPWQV
ncbi:MAG: Gfo/Idh/MocA family oxidoreductase [Planctomycetes bacterium]|nr:Gfo/Idh/MocA family oxidoreductase [Planctomycetota bacterium]